jgi:hypothetical protein
MPPDHRARGRLGSIDATGGPGARLCSERVSPVEIGLWIAAVGSALLVVVRVLRRVDERDQADREAEADLEARLLRERHEARLPGASPHAPLEVFSAAAVEPRVEALPCPRCNGRPHVLEHVVHRAGDTRLRRVTTRCGGCGHRRDVYLRLREVELH